METVHKQAQAKPEQDRQDHAGELAQLNRLLGTRLEEEQVYFFALRLCDNHTDRDAEYFARADLERLAELFVGKTGLFDHSWSARDQAARLYRTELVEEPDVVTESGEAGCWLKGYAYLLHTAENESLIAEIEGGIKKEVSVSCAVARSVCSICGNDIHDRTLCSHEKGRLYEGKRCIVRLAEPVDAYEWSFVAVPAQPMAGVVKGWAPKGGSLRQVLAWADRDGAWQKELDRLEREAAAGRQYLATLRKEVVRLGLLADFGLGGESLRTLAEQLDAAALEEMKNGLEKKLGRGLGLPVQLRYDGAAGQTAGDDGSFVI